jgi:hypothetical protein
MATLKIDVAANTASANKGIDKLQSNLKGVSGVAKGVTTAITGMMAPLIGLVAVLGGISLATKGIKDTIDLGGELDDMSSKTGIAVRDLVILKEAFKLAGMEGADLGKIVNGLSAKLDSPTPKILETMKSLGLSMAEVQKLPIGERFQVVGNAISNLSSATDRASASQILFGKSAGNNLLVLFNNRNAMNEAKASVGGLADSMNTYASRFAAIGDALDTVGTKIIQFFAQALGQNIARLQNAADWLLNLDLSNAGKELGGILNTLGDIVETMTEAKNLGELYDTFSDAIEMGWLNVKPILINGMKEVATFFANALVEAIKKANPMLAKASDMANVANAVATTVGYVAFGTGAKDGKIDSGKDYTRTQEEEDRLNTLKNRLTGDKPSEYIPVDVGEQIGKMHEAIAAYYAKISKVTEDAIKAKFTSAQDLIANFKPKTKQNPTDIFAGLMQSLGNLGARNNQENLTEKQRTGRAGIFTGNPGLSEQKETNRILNQIRDLLGKNQNTPTSIPSIATFGA